MEKSRDAFRTISEVADALGTQPHVLRFWESKFAQVKPVKRAGGRRYYRPADVALLTGIKRLLHEDGLTIKGAQKVIREQGVRYVSGLADAEPQEAPAAEPAEVVPPAPVADAVEDAPRQAPRIRRSAPAEPEPSGQLELGIPFLLELSPITTIKNKARACAPGGRPGLAALVTELRSVHARLSAGQTSW
ncbi:MAG: MerR family transcriptional regulator [Pseudomonadota bacterium]